MIMTARRPGKLLMAVARCLGADCRELVPEFSCPIRVARFALASRAGEVA
jgi:hypothetical protein